MKLLVLVFVWLFSLSSTMSTLSKSCTGHDSCKNEKWYGSYDVTCNGGERICHNTQLFCGRNTCKITIKGTGHDAYHNSIVYAQNIKRGEQFILNCKTSGQRKCKNNIIYCPREIGTECICKNCDSSTIMYYKHGTYYSSGGATLKRYWDGPVACNGRIQCNLDELTKTVDYGTSPSYYYLYKGYPSVSSSYSYNLYKDKYGNTLNFSMFISENYKTWSYQSLPGQTPSYKYKLINYTDVYGMLGKVCRKRHNNGMSYYYYKGKCNEYKYGDPYTGFWVLGEPAQSCTDACVDYNMTCDKQQHLDHLPELQGSDFGKILHRFNASCDSYTSQYIHGKRTPVYNALTRQCVLSNLTRTGKNWYCNEPPWTNGAPDEDKRRLCWCAPTSEKPQKICDRTNYINITKYNNITRYVNISRYINISKIVNITRYVNISRYINNIVNITQYHYQKRFIDVYNYTNVTLYHDKNRYIDIFTYINVTRYNDLKRYTNTTRYFDVYFVHYINKTRYIDIYRFLSQNNTNNRTENKTKNKRKNQSLFSPQYSTVVENNITIQKNKKPKQTNFIIIGGISLGSLIFFCISFYIAWHCYLKDNIEEIILEKACCGYGEFIMQMFEWIGIIDENWEKRREQREFEPYLLGLSDSEKEIVISELKRNRIRLEEATKIRWEEICKNAVRPNDKYHTELLENSVKFEEKNTHVLPGTPRRRRRVEV